MTLEQKITALPVKRLWANARERWIQEQTALQITDAAASLAASHDALMAQMVEALNRMVEMIEVHYVDGALPQNETQVPMELAAAALRAHKEQE